MKPDPFRRRGPLRLLALWGVVSAASVWPLDAVRAQAASPTPGATPAASAAPVRRVSPYVLAARRHAQEAASAPLKVNPLMSHRPRTPRATGRG